MATKTEWWDKNGKVHTGYIKDGQTFTDAETTQRVPVGATVKTNGGTFNMTENGGVPTMATARNQYQQQSNAAIDAYNAASEAQRRRVQNATDAAIAEMNRQKKVAEQNRVDADLAARDAYRAAANPFGALEEQRVRLGLDNSGYSESSKLKLASDYAAQQTENLRNLNEQLMALETQIAEARANGEYQLAEILETRAQNVMNQRTALAGNLFNADMSSISQAAQERQFREQMAFNQAQADEQRKQYIAELYLAAGHSSPELASALGITQEEADTLAAKYSAQQLALKRSSGSKSTVSPEFVKAVVNDINDKNMSVGNWLSEYGKGFSAAQTEAIWAAFYGDGKGPENNLSAAGKGAEVIFNMFNTDADGIKKYLDGDMGKNLSKEDLDYFILKYKL